MVSSVIISNICQLCLPETCHTKAHARIVLRVVISAKARRVWTGQRVVDFCRPTHSVGRRTGRFGGTLWLGSAVADRRMGSSAVSIPAGKNVSMITLAGPAIYNWSLVFPQSSPSNVAPIPG